MAFRQPDRLSRARFAAPRLIALMREVGAPSGIAELGYREADIPALVEGALKQQRLVALSPKPVDSDRLARIFAESMRNW